MQEKNNIRFLGILSWNAKWQLLSFLEMYWANKDATSYRKLLARQKHPVINLMEAQKNITIKEARMRLGVGTVELKKRVLLVKEVNINGC